MVEREPHDLEGYEIEVDWEALEKTELEMAEEWDKEGLEGAYLGFGEKRKGKIGFNLFIPFPDDCYCRRSERFFSIDYEKLNELFEGYKKEGYSHIMLGHLDPVTPELLEREKKPLEETKADLFTISVVYRPDKRTVFSIKNGKAKNYAFH